MNIIRDLDRPAGLLVMAAAVGFLIYIGNRLRTRFRSSGHAPGRSARGGEGALRALVSQVGVQLQERGVSDEDELDAAIAKAKRKTYRRRYTAAGRRHR